jgi:hypothetical protein
VSTHRECRQDGGSAPNGAGPVLTPQGPLALDPEKDFLGDPLPREPHCGELQNCANQACPTVQENS